MYSVWNRSSANEAWFSDYHSLLVSLYYLCLFFSSFSALWCSPSSLDIFLVDSNMNLISGGCGQVHPDMTGQKKRMLLHKVLIRKNDFSRVSSAFWTKFVFGLGRSGAHLKASSTTQICYQMVEYGISHRLICTAKCRTDYIGCICRHQYM